jgi:hypothetical protein
MLPTSITLIIDSACLDLPGPHDHRECCTTFIDITCHQKILTQYDNTPLHPNLTHTPDPAFGQEPCGSQILIGCR